jgi:pimeloyl-ACP methyl ester carboxylesterase
VPRRRESGAAEAGTRPYHVPVDSFRRGDLTFDVRDGGPPDGEPVVLLHGFPEDAAAWSGVEPLLHAAGLRTLAPDQRGYSPGARPRGRGAYRLTECAADVLALLDAAGLESAHVVGHDWGGAVAWQLAGSHPERLRTLTALATPHPAAMRRAWLGPQALRSWYMLAFQLPFLPEWRLRDRQFAVRSLTSAGLPREHAERYAARLAEPGAATALLNWYRAIPWSMPSPAGRSKVPTTYVWGSKDFALGRAAAEGTARYVSAPYRFVELPVGHWLPESEPEAVAEHVLDRVKNPS